MAQTLSYKQRGNLTRMLRIHWYEVKYLIGVDQSEKYNTVSKYIRFLRHVKTKAEINRLYRAVLSNYNKKNNINASIIKRVGKQRQ